MTLALEIHDVGLRLIGAGEQATMATASPGFALLEGKGGLFKLAGAQRKVITGQEAWNQARLRPRLVHHHFWRDLGTQSLPAPFPRDMSTADLAHRHLQGFWRAAQNGPAADAKRVILALPSSFSEQQLGLTLGVARACEIPVEGMVDTAVATAAGFSAAKILHFDLHQHQLVLTELRRSRSGEDSASSWIARRRVHTVDGAGQIAVIDAVARRLAALCIQASRFDPLHSAESEQQLYLQLPGWLETLRESGAARLELEGSRGEISLEVEQSDLAPALAPFLSQVQGLIHDHRGGQRAPLLVTSRLAEVLGLEATLKQLADLDVIILPPDAAAQGALRCRESIMALGDDALPFVTRLPVSADASPVESTATANNGPRDRRTEGTTADKTTADKTVPTHLVRDGLAYPISGDPFLAVAPWGQGPSCRIQQRDGQVIAEVSPHNGSDASGVFLNNRELQGQTCLTVGDQLQVGQPEDRPLELQLIAVVD